MLSGRLAARKKKARKGSAVGQHGLWDRCRQGALQVGAGDASFPFPWLTQQNCRPGNWAVIGWLWHGARVSWAKRGCGLSCRGARRRAGGPALRFSSLGLAKGSRRTGTVIKRFRRRRQRWQGVCLFGLLDLTAFGRSRVGCVAGLARPLWLEFGVIGCVGTRTRCAAASCAGRKGAPVAPAVGMRAVEHWLLAYCAPGTTFCTLWARGVWPAAGVWTYGIGLAHRTACVGALCAPPKGSLRGMVSLLSWPGYFLATYTRRIRATLTPRTWCWRCRQKFLTLGTNFTGRAQPHWSFFGMVRASNWPRYFVATCTGWKGTALTPRAWCRRWFQRCAALWADFGGRGLQVGCLLPTFATNAVVGFGVILAQVGHAYDVPTRAALPGFCFGLVRLMQLALHAACSS